jgi:hypothetical protein
LKSSGSDSIEFFLATGGEEQLRPLGSEGISRSLANSGAGSGDEDDFP